MDPYKILEIPHDATDDEVRRVYRDLAKKYHPDGFKDNPLADLATEKMKQINEAYDTIQRERAGGFSPNRPSGGGNSKLARVRELVLAGRYSEAEIVINAVPTADRGAEWNYLKGLIHMNRGWFHDAQRYFETAARMEPGNAEYREAAGRIKNNAGEFYGKGYSGANNSGCTGCDICAGLICADCLCSCCSPRSCC